MTAALMLAGVTVTVADELPTQAESSQIEEALSVWGCRDGTQRAASNGMFEIEDANCPAGQFDVTLDQNFNVLAITKN